LAEPFQPAPARGDLAPSVAPSVAVGLHGAEAGAIPLCKKALLSGHSRTPSASTGSLIGRSHSTGNTCKSSSKRSRIDGELESVGDQSHFVNLAKGSYDFKIAHLAAKRKKMELQAEREREAQRLAAEERALVLKQQMQEKEFEYKERMMQYELKLAQLKMGQTPIAVGANFGQDDHSMANAYPSNLSQDSFAFGTGAVSSTSLPSLRSPAWGTPGV